MNQDTINALREFFQENPILQGQPATPTEVEQAEVQLNANFNSDYKQFIILFGGSMVGTYPVYGITNSEVMEDRTVIDLTISFREGGWPGADHNYVFSIDQSGNAIMFDKKGAIISFDHDAGEEYTLATSFDDFILKCIS